MKFNPIKAFKKLEWKKGKVEEQPTTHELNHEQQKSVHEIGKQLEISISILPFEKTTQMALTIAKENAENQREQKTLKVTCLDINTKTNIQNQGELTAGDIVHINRFGVVQIDEILE